MKISSKIDMSNGTLKINVYDTSTSIVTSSSMCKNKICVASNTFLKKQQTF